MTDFASKEQIKAVEINIEKIEAQINVVNVEI